MQQQGIQVELEEDAIRRSAQLALQWHDKSRYVDLLHDRNHPDLPDHVPTTIISSQSLKELTWPRLQDLVGQQTGSSNSTSIFIKSTNA